jgi:uncharacterized protein YjbI with pentapeptide repeats
VEREQRRHVKAYLQGLYRLLDFLREKPEQLGRARALQQRWAAALPDFLSAEASVSQAAIRADILDDLDRLSLDVSGRSFDAFCTPAVKTLNPGLIAAPETALTLEMYTAWLDALVKGGAVWSLGVPEQVQARTLALLPHVDSTQRAPILQRLYDAGLIFTLYRQVSLAGARLSRADLTQAVLMRADLSQAEMRGAKLAEADLRYATLRKTNLITAGLGWAQLVEADLTQSEMAGAMLMGANFERANLTDANLVKATLRGANFNGANLEGANLLGANLNDAVLTSVNLSYANLLWADLSTARLEDVTLSGVAYNTQTRWPSGFNPQSADMTVID